MRRRLLNLLTALSLLLCVAVCVLWARSYWHRDSAEAVVRGHWVACYSEVGSLDASLDVRSTLGGPSELNWFTGKAAGEGLPLHAHLSDFQLSREADTLSLRVPHWIAALAAVVLPAIRLVRHRRQSLREQAAICPACGYDLRATPGRCPECGKENSSAISN